MTLPNPIYDIMKWVVIIAIPACTTFYVTLDTIFGWGFGDTVAKVSSAVCTLIGALLGISSSQYYKAKAVSIADTIEEDLGEG